VFLFLALGFHLRAEVGITDKASAPAPAPASATPAQEKPKPADHFSDGGNEPDLLPHAFNQTNTSSNASTIERRTAVVIASRVGEDPTWLDKYFPQWEKNIYRVDDSTAPLRPPKNKGRESMVYLTYVEAPTVSASSED
jgi:hypothetical protein